MKWPNLKKWAKDAFDPRLRPQPFYLLLVPASFSNEQTKTVYTIIRGSFTLPFLVVRSLKNEWDLKTPSRIGRRQMLNWVIKNFEENNIPITETPADDPPQK